MLVVGVAAVAAVIRFWHISSVGYSHWDEFYFISDAKLVGGVWPHGFTQMGWVTTPLVAFTDGTLFHFLGVHTWIPMSISALYGTAAVVAIYLLGSRLFGNAVGVIAAVVVATADFSVMFSRMALAEATFDFWLIVSVLFIWLGFTQRRLVYYVLGGVSSGLLLNTKYDGVFPLVLSAGFVAVEFFIDWVRQRSLPSRYGRRIGGSVLLVGIAVAAFAPFLYRIARNPGLATVLSHHQANVTRTLVETSPAYLPQYFWDFTSAPTVLLAAAGIVIGMLRFTQADRLLLLYTAGWLVALLLFPPYPREALSLLPAVAIWTGRAVVEAYGLVTRNAPGRLAFAIAGVCVAAILVGQAIPTGRTLSLSTLGYQQAGSVAAGYQSVGDIVFTRTQAVASLYLNDEYFMDSSPTVEQILNQRGDRVVFMTDQTLAWYPQIDQFFQRNQDHLRVANRIPNPLYDEVLLQPTTQERLNTLSNPPDDYRYITFWRVTGPLTYPSTWPQ